MAEKSTDGCCEVVQRLRIFNPTDSTEDVLKTYDDIADHWEARSEHYGYKAPLFAAEEVARLVVDESKRCNIQILDVGAGTGLAGRELNKLGFCNIDGLEPSEGMLKILRNNNFYNIIYQELIGNGTTTVPPRSYDVVLTAGGFGHSHIPLTGLRDMASLTKPGGYVVMAFRKEVMEMVSEYKGKMEQYMKQMEQQGLWQQESRKIVPNYFLDLEGIVLSYRVK